MSSLGEDQSGTGGGDWMKLRFDYAPNTVLVRNVILDARKLKVMGFRTTHHPQILHIDLNKLKEFGKTAEREGLSDLIPQLPLSPKAAHI